jgi:hypothetical protein
MAAWRLDHDVVVLGPVRMVVQRIAISHWRATGTLRSWGVAPLHRAGDGLFAPCAAGEAVWIGAWLDEESSAAQIHVSDVISGKSATGELPRDYQIAALSGEGGAPEPLTLSAGRDRRAFDLEIRCDQDSADVELTLLTPATWAALAGRGPPYPLDQPPPLPPLLG